MLCFSRLEHVWRISSSWTRRSSSSCTRRGPSWCTRRTASFCTRRGACCCTRRVSSSCTRRRSSSSYTTRRVVQEEILFAQQEELILVQQEAPLFVAICFFFCYRQKPLPPIWEMTRDVQHAWVKCHGCLKILAVRGGGVEEIINFTKWSLFMWICNWYIYLQLICALYLFNFFSLLPIARGTVVRASIVHSLKNELSINSFFFNIVQTSTAYWRISQF